MSNITFKATKTSIHSTKCKVKLQKLMLSYLLTGMRIHVDRYEDSVWTGMRIHVDRYEDSVWTGMKTVFGQACGQCFDRHEVCLERHEDSVWILHREDLPAFNLQCLNVC